MSLQQELLQLEQKIRMRDGTDKDSALLLHAKAHMFHNKRLHDAALELMSKHDIVHSKFDSLDE